MARPTILREGSILDIVSCPIDKATVIHRGDLISYENGLTTLLDVATDDVTFLGIATQSSTDEQEDNIPVLQKAVIEIDVDSADYTTGQGLAYNAKNQLVTDGGSTGANTIAWSLETKAGATRLKVLVDVVSLGKLFAVVA